MYRIQKQFHFSAAHALSYLPADHPCHHLHGHNYIVEVVLEAEELNDRHFVEDYRDLRAVKDFIDRNFDHRNLNDVMPTATSAENIARFLFEKFKTLFPAMTKVRVSETPKTWAEYFETASERE